MIKRSLIWKLPKEEFKTLWERAETLKEVLAKFGLEDKGRNGTTVRKRAKEEGLDTQKFKRNASNALKGWRLNHPKQTPEQIFQRKDKVNGKILKDALLASNIPYECHEKNCAVGAKWNGKKITLHVDHIDGDTTNNQQENLRFLCPNCHSQTKTFAGRKNKVDRRKLRPIRKNLRKVSRPTRGTLQTLLWQEPTTKIAKRFEVSDKAVEKWAKSYDLEKPPRGYWAKQKSQPQKTL